MARIWSKSDQVDGLVWYVNCPYINLIHRQKLKHNKQSNAIKMVVRHKFIVFCLIYYSIFIFCIYVRYDYVHHHGVSPPSLGGDLAVLLLIFKGGHKKNNVLGGT